MGGESGGMLVVVNEVKRDRIRWKRKGASEQETTWSMKGVDGGEREKEKGREREAARGAGSGG